jgi:hypothetical protein
MHHALDAVGAALFLERLVDARGLADHFQVFGGFTRVGFGGAQAFAGDRHGQGGEREAEQAGGAAALVHDGPPPRVR